VKVIKLLLVDGNEKEKKRDQNVNANVKVTPQPKPQLGIFCSPHWDG
jgi:hypothetical protein